MRPKDCLPPARGRARDDLPGAAHPVEPADADLPALRGDHQAARAGAREGPDQAAGPRRAAADGDPADPLPVLPARVLGRHAAAADDRAGAGAPARVHRGGRADDCPRRTRGGADRADPQRPAPQLPDVPAADHPQRRDRRRGVRPGRRHVRRPDRRGGPGRRRLREPAAPLHPGAAALDDLVAHDRTQLHPGLPAGPGRPAGRLPLPPAVSGGDGRLRHQEPGQHRAFGRRPRRVLAGRARRTRSHPAAPSR